MADTKESWLKSLKRIVKTIGDKLEDGDDGENTGNLVMEAMSALKHYSDLGGDVPEGLDDELDELSKSIDERDLKESNRIIESVKSMVNALSGGRRSRKTRKGKKASKKSRKTRGRRK